MKTKYIQPCLPLGRERKRSKEGASNAECFEASKKELRSQRTMPSFQEKTLMIKPQMNKKIPDRDLREKKNTKEKALKEDG